MPPGGLLSKLDAALDGKPWSLSGLLHSHETICDDEGRPLLEGRAPVGSREGAAMDLKRCPYGDERGQRWMNASALAQVTQHFSAIVSGFAAVRALFPIRLESWGQVAAILAHPLAGPTLHLLRARSRAGVLPAKVAVRFKVAVGYSDPLRILLDLEAQGLAPEVSAASLLELVRERRLLVGNREGCAAPPSMLVHVSEALLHGSAEPGPAPDRQEQAIASAIAMQMRLGAVWGLFDRLAERDLLFADHGPEALAPRNAYLRRKLSGRLSAIAAPEHRVDSIALPRELGEAARRGLGDAIAAYRESRGERSTAAVQITELYAYRDGAVFLRDDSVVPHFAARFAAYVRVYRLLLDALWALEVEMRRELGFSIEAPFLAGAEILPMPRALPWFEMVCGHRLRFSERIFKNQNRSVPLAVN